MARAINRLSALKVRSLTTPGRHADGGGLYLVIDAAGAKRWAMLYRLPGRRREMGLGSAGPSGVPLAKARELAAAARAKIEDGVDPLAERQAERRVAAAPVSFEDVATTYMTLRAQTWRNAAHRAQWRQTLEVQAARLWSAPVAAIGTDDVLAVLKPIWQKTPETARRLRGRIEKILDAARVGGHREGDNPARWRGHLEVLLPRAGKLTRGHHAALPYADLPALYARLARADAPSVVALRFLILTAARSGEVRGMPWREIDMEDRIWTVPAERMKAKREHRVPLTLEMMDLLGPPGAPDALVFPSVRGKMMSDMVFGMLLRRLGLDVTTHGFRSTFRDWVDEATDFPGDLAEAALAHLTGDATERAYRRGDGLAKRRHLMDAWSAFVGAMVTAESSSLVSSS